MAGSESPSKLSMLKFGISNSMAASQRASEGDGSSRGPVSPFLDLPEGELPESPTAQAARGLPVWSPESPDSFRDPPVVVGILGKYINVRGWRPRIFVLESGVISYYKIHGDTAVNVRELLEKLKREGSGTLQVIGTEVSRQQAISPKAAKSYARGEPKPQGELHLQLCNPRTSRTDNRKMYLNSGVMEMSLRAESRDDRRAWLQAILSGKGQVMLQTSRSQQFSSTLSLSMVGHSPQPDAEHANHFRSVVSDLTQTLRQGHVSMDMIELVEKIMAQENMRNCELLGVEMDKRRKLLQYMQQVEDDKRALETAIVVDVNQKQGGSLARVSGAVATSIQDLEDRESLSSSSGVAAGDAAGDESSDDDGAEVFYDCGHDEHGKAYSSATTPDSKSTEKEAEVGLHVAPDRVMNSGTSMSAKTAPEFPQDEAQVQRRTSLPVPAEKERSVSLWSIIRDCIGKDLTRICLPVFFNEPISALQKSAEDMEYSELLDKAAACGPGSEMRMLYVGAFAASSYSSTIGRTRKPFNPLLGETYELVVPEKGYRFVSEKVCHHPTILCAICQGRGWLFEGDGEVKSKFWGRYIELHPVGTMQVTFSDGEVYRWNKVVTSINNLIVGKLYIDHGGVMRIVNKATGLQAKIRFKETGFMDKNPRQLKGHLEDAAGKKLPGTILGKWDSYMHFHKPNGEEVHLWKAARLENSNKYNMTGFSIVLNEMMEDPSSYAPTDCRLRPDQRALEDGRFTDADKEKQRLEQKQRQARKAAQEGVPLNPRWFEAVRGVALGEELAYKYKGGYFECKASGDFSGCRDIFGE